MFTTPSSVFVIDRLNEASGDVDDDKPPTMATDDDDDGGGNRTLEREKLGNCGGMLIEVV